MKKMARFLFSHSSFILWTLLLCITHGYGQTVPRDINATGFSATLLEAGNTITLSPGFITEGNSFTARIRNDLYVTDQTQNLNYIKTEDVFVPLKTTTAVGDANVSQKSISYQYFDGLGRPIQSVSVKETPQLNDLVAHVEYDAYGRQAKEFLPFAAAPGDGAFKASAGGAQTSFYDPAKGIYNNTVKTDPVPYKLSLFEPSPLNRVTQTGAGAAWQPDANNFNGTNNKAVKFSFGTNTHGTGAGQEQLIKWTISSNLPSNAGYYASSQLSVNTTYDEENRQVRQYTNKEGQVILKKVQAVTGTAATNNDAHWAMTYYVYDDFGNLRFVLPPEFMQYAGTAITTLKVDPWCFQYRYDTRNRMIYKRVPGANPMEMVYDKWDRLVFTRDGNQANAGKWLFTKYDALNRPVMTGEMANASTQATLQTAVDNYYTTNPNNRFEVPAVNSIGYTTTTTYPTTVVLTDLFTISYYDDYSYKTNLSLGTAYDFASVSGFTGTPTARVKGKPTGSKVRVLGTTTWLVTASYYDDRSRLLQSVGDDHKGNKNRITNEYYGLTGWVTKSKQDHGNGLLARLTETEYDHRGRVLRTFSTLDGSTRTMLTSNTYNELGQLVEKNIHSTNGGASFLQSNDYRYNIRGWMTHINNSQLTNDGTYNNDGNDLYGMQLMYNEAAESINGTNTNPQFNGNIAAMKWTTNNLVDATKEKIYGFDYDAMNRLTGSHYAAKSSGVWTADVGNFDESLTYDKVGNILSLNRYGWFGGAKVYIDQLTYAYKGMYGGNQLINVRDNSLHYQWGKADAGFVEATHASGVTEMDYDFSGNLKLDLNKNITAITYNHLNLPSLITISGGKSIEYTYDAAGSKLKYKAIDNGVVIKESDYIGGIQYEAGQLAFVMTGEGRAMKRGTNNWEYEYHLKDHLGNTRVAFGNLQDVDSYTATMETEKQTYEEATFKNIANRRNATYNHTAPPNAEVPAPSQGAWLNGGTNPSRELGPGKFLNLTAGDKIKMEVYVRYNVAGGNAADVVASLLGAVTTSFNATAGENAAAYNGFNSYLPGLVNTVSNNSGQPKAYLNYILFDGNYANPQFGYQVLSSTASAGWEKLSLEVTASATGYGYIYVTNESNYNVYFDDLKIVHEKTSSSLKVVQVQDYYPFGLTFNSYSRENTTPNPYLYNGKEIQDELNLNVYDYGARNYDPAIGRWWQIDPLSELARRWSPYQYCYDNPIRFIDPDGMYSTEEWKRDNGITDDDLVTVYEAPETEPERKKAVQTAREQTGTPYGQGEGKIDCSGLVDKGTTSAGITTKKGEGVNGWANGVALIVGNSRKISADEIREGDLATFRSGRSDHKGEDGEFDHIGIISKVGYVDGKVAGFNMIHAGGSGVKEVYVDLVNSFPGYQLKNFYQWDTPDAPGAESNPNLTVPSSSSTSNSGNGPTLQPASFSLGAWLINNSNPGSGLRSIGRTLYDNGY